MLFYKEKVQLSNLNKVDDKRYSDSFLISVWERSK